MEEPLVNMYAEQVLGAAVMQVSYRRPHAIVCLVIVLCSKIKRLTRNQNINLIFRILLA